MSQQDHKSHQDQPDQQSQQSQPDQQGLREFSCAGPVTATVRAGGGLLTVTAREQFVATVAVAPHDGSDASAAAAELTKVTFSDGHLHVETPQRSSGFFRQSGRVRIDLGLPLDSSLRARVGSADLRADGRLADVNVQSGSGDAYLTTIAGDLSVESGSGDVRADDVGGALRVATASGDVRATVVTGEATVKSASGDVEVERATGAVRVSTASGDVRVGEASGREVRVNSASGDVSVGVPAGTRVWLDLTTMSGSTISDLDISDARPSGDNQPSGDAQLSLRVQTMSGDITVRRVARSTPA